MRYTNGKFEQWTMALNCDGVRTCAGMTIDNEMSTTGHVSTMLHDQIMRHKW